MSVEIREARPDDAEVIVTLIADLGHDMTADTLRNRLAELRRTDCDQLVAVREGRVVGLCGLHVMTTIHRPRPVGRLTILAVAEELRGQGIGRRLVQAAETRLRETGCGLIEVTSNDRLVEAHQFYGRVGYERTSKRFAKTL
jgi:predicted N-acetyltransferase YhbS